MSIRPFVFPLPETRFFIAGCRVYKFKIRNGSDCRRRNERLSNEEVTQEIEDAIRVVLANLDHLQPFTTKRFNVFPYRSKWERVSTLCFWHGELKLAAYPFLLTLYLEVQEAPCLHLAKRPVDETSMGIRDPDEVTALKSAVHHPKRIRTEPSAGCPAQLSWCKHKTIEGLEFQPETNMKLEQEPDGPETMVADKGFPAYSMLTHTSKGSPYIYSPADKDMTRQEGEGTGGAQARRKGHFKEAEECEPQAPTLSPTERGHTGILLHLARKIFPISLFFGCEKN